MSFHRFLHTSRMLQPRHLTSMLDLSQKELKGLVDKACAFKTQYKSGNPPPAAVAQSLTGKLVALVFSKRSTRTRISTEGAAVHFGAHPMFLGKDDIQLGVNESLYDTTRVISSMTSCIFARVNKNSEIQQLCQHSSVPIINALCDKFHPLQAITDIMTIKEAFGKTEGLKLAWIGDSNNVINDLLIASLKSGISVSIATPEGIEMDSDIVEAAEKVSQETGSTLTLTHNPLEAVEDANVLVTDTWVSMGQESEYLAKVKQFSGFQITEEMAQKGKAASNWKFMHCLPRHKEEVDDAIFYSDKSVVFEEAENRLYAAMAAIDGFVVNKGKLI